MIYDFLETGRVGMEWMGATARAMGSSPGLRICTPHVASALRGWGDVTERSFSRMTMRPDWMLTPVAGADGMRREVYPETVMSTPFADLVRFRIEGAARPARKLLVVAPMSGHHATLLRPTIQALLETCDVWVTDWRNARDIPVEAGAFDVEDYTVLVERFLGIMGPGSHVLAVCQPVPLVLAATARMEAREDSDRPASLVLMGGPVDPAAAPTEVSDFGRLADIGWLETTALQTVGVGFAGRGRLVYPGSVQIASFMAMNVETHLSAFAGQVMRSARGAAAQDDRHNRFYDEYLAVMDMPAEFYISTVERIFKGRDIAGNRFSVKGEQVDLSAIRTTPILVVEGEEDDISAPGQCRAAFDLISTPAHLRHHHLEPGAGHYGIFAGRGWREGVYPAISGFYESLSARPA